MHRTDNQFLEIMRERYSLVKTRDEKSILLNEYCRQSGQSRKYAIKLLRGSNVLQTERKGRGPVYSNDVTRVLVKIWTDFNYPCGQKLKVLISYYLDGMRRYGDLIISDDVAAKLKRISPATIDRKLRLERQSRDYRSLKTGRMHIRDIYEAIAITKTTTCLILTPSRLPSRMNGS